MQQQKVARQAAKLKFRALNRIPGSDSKKESDVENRTRSNYRRSAQALSGMMRGKQSKEMAEDESHAGSSLSTAPATREVKRTRPKSSGAGMQRSETVESCRLL